MVIATSLKGVKATFGVNVSTAPSAFHDPVGVGVKVGNGEFLAIGEENLKVIGEVPAIPTAPAVGVTDARLSGPCVVGTVLGVTFAPAGTFEELAAPLSPDRLMIAPITPPRMRAKPIRPAISSREGRLRARYVVSSVLLKSCRDVSLTTKISLVSGPDLVICAEEGMRGQNLYSGNISMKVVWPYLERSKL
jgi:hypothetical protein